MQNQKAAVTVMHEHLKDIEFIFPRDADPVNFLQLVPEEAFSENAISFLNSLSVLLMNDPRSNDFPEIITFAFFCRRANSVELKKMYCSQSDKRNGRGIVFHIPPSNMPLNCAYSLVSGILSGNLNIIRLPSKRFKQIEIITEAIEILNKRPEFKLFSQRTMFIRYDKLSSATAYFSSICDARIIWGGDTSVEEIQKNSLSANAVDVAFADKYSICVINADSFVQEEKPQRFAQSFYNDTFLFDQNACTSPHLIVWLGNNENIRRSKQIFWNHLHDLVKEQYDLQPMSAIDKLTAFYKHAIKTDGIYRIAMPDNLIWRIEIKQLSEDINKHRCNSGYFLEYNAASLAELADIITKKPQTIASYGIRKEEWDQLGLQKKIDLTDRIKPIGKTSEFSLTWDGINLIDALSVRAISKAEQPTVLNSK